MHNQKQLSQFNTGERKYWIDAIKGVAIILVILSHTQTIPYVQYYLGACYMQLFFIASGYVYRDYAGSISRKWKQLLVPYFSWSFFYLCCSAIYLSFTQFQFQQMGIWIAGVFYSRFSIFTDASSANLIQFPLYAGPMWFLTCMALAYLGFVPLLKAKGKLLILLILAYLAISVAFLFCPILLPWSLDTAFVAALLIYAGYRLKSVSLSTLQYLCVLFVCGIIYLMLVRINSGINMSIREYGRWGGLSVLIFVLIGLLGTICYSIFFMFIEKTKICRFFAYFGRMSLTIMCAHMFCVQIFEFLFEYFVGNITQMHPVVLFFTRLIFVILMCILIHYIISYVKRCLQRN